MFFSPPKTVAVRDCTLGGGEGGCGVRCALALEFERRCASWLLFTRCASLTLTLPQIHTFLPSLAAFFFLLYIHISSDIPCCFVAHRLKLS